MKNPLYAVVRCSTVIRELYDSLLPRSTETYPECNVSPFDLAALLCNHNRRRYGSDYIHNLYAFYYVLIIHILSEGNTGNSKKQIALPTVENEKSCVAYEMCK